MSGGKKFDQGKPDPSLIPIEAVMGTAKALSYGANKYGKHNYKEGITFSRLTAAAMRHLLAFNNGEDIDGESGNQHLHHALASLAMLSYMVENKPDMDDRYHPKENTCCDGGCHANSGK